MDKNQCRNFIMGFHFYKQPVLGLLPSWFSLVASVGVEEGEIDWSGHIKNVGTCTCMFFCKQRYLLALEDKVNA